MAIGRAGLKSNRAAKKDGIRGVRAGSGAAKVSSRRPFRPNAPRAFADPFASPNVECSLEARSGSDWICSTDNAASTTTAGQPAPAGGFQWLHHAVALPTHPATGCRQEAPVE